MRRPDSLQGDYHYCQSALHHIRVENFHKRQMVKLIINPKLKRSQETLYFHCELCKDWFIKLNRKYFK